MDYFLQTGHRKNAGYNEKQKGSLDHHMFFQSLNILIAT